MLSSISQVVEAANSKLAIFLRSKEDEEASLGIGKKKLKLLLQQELRLPVGKARWLIEPDFTVPDAFAERPSLENGVSSFHFSCTPISKTAAPTFRNQAVEGPFSIPEDPALRHSKYIEREGAAERYGAAKHSEYVERPGAVEVLDALSFTERPTDDELDALSGQLDISGGKPSVFSNISDDPIERQEYWRAVERCERNPRVHELILEPEICLRWWQELPSTTVLDPEFKTHALMAADDYRQWLDSPAPEGKEKPPFKAAPFKVSAERAGEIIMQAQQMKGYEVYRPPFEFKSGRGGRIQFRFVASLPHEASAEDRAVIVRIFCDHIGSLIERRRPDGTVGKVGMMYTAVIHAPDPRNHRRNYHAHVVAHDRPAKFLEEFECWDFEYQEIYTSHRKTRTRFPYRQNKIEEVTRSADDRSNVETAGLQFIPTLRKKFAEITNTVLEARGIKRRYDPRKYSEMGVDRQPTKPMGSKAAALETIGVPTVIGVSNAFKIWSDEERAIAKRMDRAQAQQRKDQKDLQDRIDGIASSLDPTDRVLVEARRSLRERDRLIYEVGRDRAAILMFNHQEAKARSRAQRTQQTCGQYLEEIATGRATKSIRALKGAIKERLKAATDHITAIDHALESHRRDLAWADRNITRREGQIDALHRSLERDVAVLERRAQSARSVRESQDVQQAAYAEGASDAPALSSSRGRGVAGGEEMGADTVSATDPRNGSPRQSSSEELTTRDEAKTREPEKSASLIRTSTTHHEAAEEDANAPELSHNGASFSDQRISRDKPANPAPAAVRAAADPKPASGSNDDRPSWPADRGLAASLVTPKALEPAAEAEPQADDPALIDRVAADDENLRSRDGSAMHPCAENEPTPEPLGGSGAEHPMATDPAPAANENAEANRHWDALINRIARDRILIKEIDGKSNTKIYKVPSLSPEEQELLHAKRFHGKTIKRLAALAHQQRQEINKLVRWIRSEHGQNSDLLILEGRTAKLGTVRPSVRTMFQNWGRHADVAAALQTESARRIELAAQLVAERTRPTAKRSPAPDADRGADRAARKAEAERIYPAPDQVYTREVSEFTRLLRELAPEADVQAAVREIQKKPDAIEDVRRHTRSLAQAYDSRSDDFELRDLVKMDERNRQLGDR